MCSISSTACYTTTAIKHINYKRYALLDVSWVKKTMCLKDKHNDPKAQELKAFQNLFLCKKIYVHIAILCILDV